MTATYPRLLALPACGLSARLRRKLAMLALATIALSTLFTIVDMHAAAWNPGHGHIYRNGIAVAHTHPWNQLTREASLACVAPPAGADVVFTPSAEALAGASIAAPVLAGDSVAACAPALTQRPAPAAAPAVFAGAIASVPTPPPRG